eukprot:jgi/Bigna1/126792/aug1.3_g1500
METPFSLQGSVARARFQSKALIRAACEGRAEAVEQLLEAKADPNEEFLGHTALHCAVWALSANAADLLLRHKADVSVRTPTKESSLGLAITRGEQKADFLVLESLSSL